MRIEEKLGRLLREKGLTLATAKSCTGGLVADRITDIPGSSAYFLGGVVAYDNRIKTEVLQVPQETLKRHGAVSEATVRAMAEGARSLLGADLAVSVSGVAGPGGGSEEKPVGLTWIGLAAREGPDTAVLLAGGPEGEQGGSGAGGAGVGGGVPGESTPAPLWGVNGDGTGGHCESWLVVATGGDG